MFQLSCLDKRKRKLWYIYIFDTMWKIRFFFWEISSNQFRHNTHCEPLFFHYFLILFFSSPTQSLFRKGLPNITKYKVEILFWDLMFFMKLQTYSLAYWLHTVCFYTCTEHLNNIHYILFFSHADHLNHMKTLKKKYSKNMTLFRKQTNKKQQSNPFAKMEF